MKISLTNSKKTAEVDSCCFKYFSQFEWHLMKDGRAARLEPCDIHDEPHLVYMDEEVIERHWCDYEREALEDEE